MNEIIIATLLAIVQGITEFFPISSSGHLALLSNIFFTPSLAFFVVLHLASLLAVLVFTRKEILRLAKFDKKDRKYLLCLLIGIIPAGLVGYFSKNIIEAQFNSLLFVGFAFIFSGAVILMTFASQSKKSFNFKSAFIVGLAQILALFPGISRSGMTLSSARLLNIKNEEAFNFSFLMFIPLTIGAMILEIGAIKLFSAWVLIPFIVCFLVSLVSLSLLRKIMIGNKFWMFSIYCFLIGIVTLVLYFLGF